MVISGVILMVFAMCGAGASLLTARFLKTFAAGPAPYAGPFPPMTLLKPLHCDEAGLRESLESFCNQDYPAPYQIVFGVQAPNDPAIEAVEALRARFPHIAISLVTDGRMHGTNPKISNLMNMLPAADHEMLVLTDSDIRVAPDYLRNLVAVAAQPGVGAATCLYSGESTGKFWSGMAAGGINYQFLPNVVLATSLGIADPCFGSTIALKKSTLAAIGGFESFRNALADDYEIGRAVRARGFRVVFPSFAVSHMCSEDNWHRFFNHELRWARTIRAVDKRGYTGSIALHGFPLALIAASLMGFSLDATLALAAVLATRLYLKRRIDTVFGNTPLSPWLLPLRDIISFAVYFVSFFGRRVEWRGMRFHVDVAGTLTRS